MKGAVVTTVGLWDVLHRMMDPMLPWPDIYSDTGPFTRELNMRVFNTARNDLHGFLQDRIAVHYISGSPLVIRVLFAIHVAALCCLLVGFRTTTATVIVKLLHEGLFFRV